MGIYTRFKKNPTGFRALVELLETTPASRRKKMIDAGNKEDPAYTKKALAYIFTFEDILNLPDGELTELIAMAPPRMTAIALNPLGDEVKQRFLKLAIPKVHYEIKDLLYMKVGLSEVGGAQIRLIEVARQLEKKGVVRTKRIP